MPSWPLRQDEHAGYDEDRYYRRGQRPAQRQTTIVDRFVQKVTDSGP